MNILDVKNISFDYPDGTKVLEDVNFSIKKGEFIGILGANGSGKTTLIRILNGLLKPKDGEIFLEEKDFKKIDRNLLFSKICTMFQNPLDQLFAPTVKEDIAFGPINMGLPKDEVNRRIEYALNSIGMTEFREKAIHALSYGQKKRICLAGVLAMDPEIILLDEPTASLDPMGENSIMHLLRNLNKEKGLTMILATHSIDLVPIFIDRVIIINNGRIATHGSPEEVFRNTEAVRNAKLRLPRIGHLFEILKNKDGMNLDQLPLTIGEARDKILKLTKN